MDNKQRIRELATADGQTKWYNRLVANKFPHFSSREVALRLCGIGYGKDAGIARIDNLVESGRCTIIILPDARFVAIAPQIDCFGKVELLMKRASEGSEWRSISGKTL